MVAEKNYSKYTVQSTLNVHATFQCLDLRSGISFGLHCRVEFGNLGCEALDGC